MTVAQKPLFLSTCHQCCGTTRIPENPADPGNGWTLPCPNCASTSDLLEARREYDPERAQIPY